MIGVGGIPFPFFGACAFFGEGKIWCVFSDIAFCGVFGILKADVEVCVSVSRIGC